MCLCKIMFWGNTFVSKYNCCKIQFLHIYNLKMIWLADVMHFWGGCWDKQGKYQGWKSCSVSIWKYCTKYLEILHRIFGGNSAATQFRLRECINLDKNMVSSENARNKLGEILHMPALGQMLISDNSATKSVNSKIPCFPKRFRKQTSIFDI